MYPTVAEVVELPEVLRGHPRVLAGEASMDRLVRWVHVLEVRDVVGHVQGGEFVLTTGIALPDTKAELRSYVDALSSNGVAGLAVELGRRWQAIPPALVQEAVHRDLVLIALQTPVPFISITETVHAMILNAQYGALKAAEQMHEVFNRLGIEGATVQEILDETAGWAGAPVVLESPSHRVLGVSMAGRDRRTVLGDWEQRSRRAHVVDEDGRAGPEGWLVTPVGARGRTWGRLVLQPGDERSPHQRITLDRAASALALSRFIEPSQLSLEREAHHSVLTEILSGRLDDKDLHARTAALGVPTVGRTLIGIVARAKDAVGDEGGKPEDDALIVSALARTGAKAVVAPLDGGIGILLTVAVPGARDQSLRQLAEAIHQEYATAERQVVIGVGMASTTMAQAATSLHEGATVAQAARCRNADKPYLELSDVRLDGLLSMLRHDPRLEAFVERELGPLLADTSHGGTELLHTLQAYLSAGGNHSLAAKNLHLSRQALYRRMERLEQTLHVDLNDPESCLSLHVALIAHRRTGGDRRLFDGG